MPAGEALVGEIEIAVGGEGEIVDALERFDPEPFEKRRDLSAHRIEDENAALVIGDEDAPVAVDGKPVRPAVIGLHHVERALR